MVGGQREQPAPGPAEAGGRRRGGRPQRSGPEHDDTRPAGGAGGRHEHAARVVSGGVASRVARSSRRADPRGRDGSAAGCTARAGAVAAAPSGRRAGPPSSASATAPVREPTASGEPSSRMIRTRPSSAAAAGPRTPAGRSRPAVTPLARRHTARPAVTPRPRRHTLGRCHTPGPSSHTLRNPHTRYSTCVGPAGRASPRKVCVSRAAGAAATAHAPAAGTAGTPALRTPRSRSPAGSARAPRPRARSGTGWSRASAGEHRRDPRPAGAGPAPSPRRPGPRPRARGRAPPVPPTSPLLPLPPPSPRSPPSTYRVAPAVIPVVARDACSHAEEATPSGDTGRVVDRRRLLRAVDHDAGRRRRGVVRPAGDLPVHPDEPGRQMRMSALHGEAGGGKTVENGGIGHAPSTRAAARAVRPVAGSGNRSRGQVAGQERDRAGRPGSVVPGVRATSRGRASRGTRRGPPPPRRSCRPGGSPRRRTAAGRPARRRSG